jgi:hypothetical protein
MTVADLIRVLLDLDKQCLTSRPSPWGLAALLVHGLADHAEISLRGPGPDIFGDYASIDLSVVRKPVRVQGADALRQPALDAMLSEEYRRIDAIPHLVAACRKTVELIDPDRAPHILAAQALAIFDGDGAGS